MTVKSFYLNATTRTAQARYTMIANNGWERHISRAAAAKIKNDPEFPVGWRVEKTIVESIVTACPWCGARPLQYEMDCDGPASTGSCGSDQCNGLRRCEGCGEDGTAYSTSYRGTLCDECYDTAMEHGLMAAWDRYELIPAV